MLLSLVSLAMMLLAEETQVSNWCILICVLLVYIVLLDSVNVKEPRDIFISVKTKTF